MNKYEMSKYRLLFYGMKHEWVKALIEKEDINFGVSLDCSREEIEDYIRVIKSETINKTIDILREKMKEEREPLKQAEILSTILDLKKMKNKELGVEIKNEN